MRYHGVAIERLGSVVGEIVPAHQAIQSGRYTAGQADRTGYESIAVCTDRTGPQLAVQAARQALAGETCPLALHLHATIHDPGMDFWSAAGYVADQVGVDVRMTMSLNVLTSVFEMLKRPVEAIKSAQNQHGRAQVSSPPSAAAVAPVA